MKTIAVSAREAGRSQSVGFTVSAEEKAVGKHAMQPAKAKPLSSVYDEMANVVATLARAAEPVTPAGKVFSSVDTCVCRACDSDRRSLRPAFENHLCQFSPNLLYVYRTTTQASKLITNFS